MYGVVHMYNILIVYNGTPVLIHQSTVLTTAVRRLMEGVTEVAVNSWDLLRPLAAPCPCRFDCVGETNEILASWLRFRLVWLPVRLSVGMRLKTQCLIKPSCCTYRHTYLCTIVAVPPPHMYTSNLCLVIDCL